MTNSTCQNSCNKIRPRRISSSRTGQPGRIILVMGHRWIHQTYMQWYYPRFVGTATRNLKVRRAASCSTGTRYERDRVQVWTWKLKLTAPIGVWYSGRSFMQAFMMQMNWKWIETQMNWNWKSEEIDRAISCTTEFGAHQWLEITVFFSSAISRNLRETFRSFPLRDYPESPTSTKELFFYPVFPLRVYPNLIFQIR